MGERVYSTRRRISIMPRLSAYSEEADEEEEGTQDTFIEEEEEVEEEEEDTHSANPEDPRSSLLLVRPREDEGMTRQGHWKPSICGPSGETSPAASTALHNKHFIRSQSFDEGEGEDLDEVFDGSTKTPASHHTPLRATSVQTPPHRPSTLTPEDLGDTELDVKSSILQGLTTAASNTTASGTTASGNTAASSNTASGNTATTAPASADATNKPFRINVHLSKIREENLLKKRSLTKQSKMPELAETSESELAKASNHTEQTIKNYNDIDQSSSVPIANGAFPSLPDETLDHLGLQRRNQDPQDSAEQLTEQEVEEKFASLALAFKTDKLTLEKRIELHERARDTAEQNVNREIDGLKEAMKTLSSFCTDAQSRDAYTTMQHHVEVLEQSTSRVSSRAEVHGAVQQELRMSKAMEVMVNHVDNLKRLYDKERQDLEETRKLLQENKILGQGDKEGSDPLHKRSYSLAGSGGLKPGGRRRASVAALPRRQSLLVAGSSTASAPDQSMFTRMGSSTSDDEDPKTRFQTLVADASNKTNVVEQFRSSLSGSVDDLVFSNNNRKDSVDSIKADAKSEKNTPNEDQSRSINEEAIFQKGYEEGVRAQVNADLANLRSQQTVFLENLEHLLENDVSEEEEQKLTESWVELAWRLWPGWQTCGQRLRFTVAGFIFFLALLTVIFTVMPVGSASHRDLSRYHWTVRELLHPYVSVRYAEVPPT